MDDLLSVRKALAAGLFGNAAQYVETTVESRDKEHTGVDLYHLVRSTGRGQHSSTPILSVSTDSIQNKTQEYHNLQSSVECLDLRASCLFVVQLSLSCPECCSFTRFCALDNLIEQQDSVLSLA